jgi:hypothetical protein
MANRQIHGMMAFLEVRSIEKRLEEAGYAHRPSKLNSCREVYHIDSGEVIGIMDPLQAVEFLNAQ